MGESGVTPLHWPSPLHWTSHPHPSHGTSTSHAATGVRTGRKGLLPRTVAHDEDGGLVYGAEGVVADGDLGDGWGDVCGMGK